MRGGVTDPKSGSLLELLASEDSEPANDSEFEDTASPQTDPSEDAASPAEGPAGRKAFGVR